MSSTNCGLVASQEHKEAKQADQPDVLDTIQQLGRQLPVGCWPLALAQLVGHGTMGFPARCLAIVRRTKPRLTLSSRAVARQVGPESTLSTMRAYFEGW